MTVCIRPRPAAKVLFLAAGLVLEGPSSAGRGLQTASADLNRLPNRLEDALLNG